MTDRQEQHRDPGRAGLLIERVGYADIALGFAMFLLGEKIIPIGPVIGDLDGWQIVGLFGAMMGAGTVLIGRALAATARKTRRGPVDRD